MSITHRRNRRGLLSYHVDGLDLRWAYSSVDVLFISQKPPLVQYLRSIFSFLSVAIFVDIVERDIRNQIDNRAGMSSGFNPVDQGVSLRHLVARLSAGDVATPIVDARATSIFVSPPSAF